MLEQNKQKKIFDSMGGDKPLAQWPVLAYYLCLTDWRGADDPEMTDEDYKWIFKCGPQRRTCT